MQRRLIAKLVYFVLEVEFPAFQACKLRIVGGGTQGLDADLAIEGVVTPLEFDEVVLQ